MKPLSLGLKGKKCLSQISSRGWIATPFLLPSMVPPLWGHSQAWHCKGALAPSLMILLLLRKRFKLFRSSFLLNKNSFVLSVCFPNTNLTHLPHIFQGITEELTCPEALVKLHSILLLFELPVYLTQGHLQWLHQSHCHCHYPQQNKGLSPQR